MTTTELDDIATIKAVSALIDLNPDASATTKAETAIRTYLSAIGAGGQAVAVPTVNELFANCDRWGAVEWFNRLAMAIHNRDKAVVAGDDLSFATYDNIAKSSAARLVHDFEQEVRSALSQPLPADERVVEALPEGTLAVHGKDVVIAYDDFKDARRAFNILENMFAPKEGRS